MAGAEIRANSFEYGETYALGGLGFKSAFMISKILSLGSAQNDRGFSPGTLSGSSFWRRSWLSSFEPNQLEVARAAAMLQYSAGKRTVVSFMVAMCD